MIQKSLLVMGALITAAGLKSACAGEYRAYAGNPAHGVLASTNATVSASAPADPGQEDSEAISDPLDGVTSYTQTTPYYFQWCPEPDQNDPQPNTVTDATHIYSVSGGPVEAHAVGVGTTARATAYASLSPYGTFYVDTAQGNPATATPPADNQSETVSSHTGLINEEILPNGEPGVEVDVTVSANSSVSAVATGGGTNRAWAQVNGIGIRTEAVVYPHAP